MEVSELVSAPVVAALAAPVAAPVTLDAEAMAAPVADEAVALESAAMAAPVAAPEALESAAKAPVLEAAAAQAGAPQGSQTPTRSSLAPASPPSPLPELPQEPPLRLKRLHLMPEEARRRQTELVRNGLAA